MNIEEIKQKIKKFLEMFDGERRELFLPFHIVLNDIKEHKLYNWSLFICKYFVDNAQLFTKEDEEFWKVIKSKVNGKEINVKGEYPFKLNPANFLKIIYCMREK